LGGGFLPRFRIKFTEEKIEQLIREGRGQGEGDKYSPWLHVGDFSSQGRSHRVNGIKLNRIHHFFSDLEQQYFYLLAWQDDVIDIREQFPLFPVKDTEHIAAELDIKHPQNIGLQNSMIMTTDFLITAKTGDKTMLKARSVKYQKDLENSRTKEKLAIEHLYWDMRSIEWKVVAENSFDREKAKRIAYLMGYFQDPFAGLCSKDEKMRFMQDLINCLIEHRNEKVKDLCLFLDRQNSLPDGSLLSLFLHLSARKYIPVKIDVNFRATTQVENYVQMEELIQTIENGGYNIAIS
jgi:hypothetical protein